MSRATYEQVLHDAAQLPLDEQQQLIEDLQDAAWARDYEARKAAGLLTPEERDPLPWDQARAEIECERAGQHVSS